MISQSQRHPRCDILLRTVVVLLPDREEGIRQTEIVVAFEQFERGRSSLSRTGESGRPASEPRVEQPDRQILPLDRGCVEQTVGNIPICDGTPHILQFLPFACLLDDAVVGIGTGFEMDSGMSATRVVHALAVSDRQGSAVWAIAIGHEVRHMAVSQLVQFMVD